MSLVWVVNMMRPACVLTGWNPSVPLVPRLSDPPRVAAVGSTSHGRPAGPPAWRGHQGLLHAGARAGAAWAGGLAARPARGGWTVVPGLVLRTGPTLLRHLHPEKPRGGRQLPAGGLTRGGLRRRRGRSSRRRTRCVLRNLPLFLPAPPGDQWPLGP